MSESIFIVIEGLDGSGKTSVARQLAYYLLATHKKKVKLTFQPHDPSCGGLFIRQVLEKKITDFSPETLMLAFAANRMDHCDREIEPWLASGNHHIVLCDRYYLSSLVYQSNDQFSMRDVLAVNAHARQPDITFFFNVSNEVCYQRMKHRNKPKELFERDLTTTREKYFEGIEFLREERNEEIVVIDASGTIEEVLSAIVKEIQQLYTGLELDLSSLDHFIKQPDVFSLNGSHRNAIHDIVEKVYSAGQWEKASDQQLGEKLRSEFDGLNLNQLGALFLDHLEKLGYKKGEKLPWTHLDAYALTYELPGGITQRGTALLISERQKYDVILGSVSKLVEMTDFMFVFSPGPSELVTHYYERDIVSYAKKEKSLFPSTLLITEEKLQQAILEKLKEKISAA